MTGVADEEQKIQEAARWLSRQGARKGNIINTIREKFALSARQACEACRVAQELRVGGGR